MATRDDDVDFVGAGFDAVADFLQACVERREAGGKARRHRRHRNARAAQRFVRAPATMA